jgi:RhoGAP domain
VIGPGRLEKVPPTSADLEATNLDAEEWSGDISNVTSVLKLWLRDLPEPLLTSQLHQGFLDAASEFSLVTLLDLSGVTVGYGQKSTMTV